MHAVKKYIDFLYRHDGAGYWRRLAANMHADLMDSDVGGRRTYCSDVLSRIRMHGDACGADTGIALALDTTVAVASGV
jgi:hypothetical protein